MKAAVGTLLAGTLAILLHGEAAGERPPPGLEDLVLHPPSHVQGPAMGAGQRRAAMRVAALGYGSRAGLARRSWEISRIVSRHASSLDRIYRFRDLMLETRGFVLMPPVLAETSEAFNLGRQGRKAARARRVLRMVDHARIVSAAPHWRDFLARNWSESAPPSAVLFPRDESEASLWRQWIRDGWRQGASLADDIFAEDLDRLNRVFEGVVLWRRAWRARIVSRPRLAFNRTSVHDGESRLDIDRTRIRIAVPSRFNPHARTWNVEIEEPIDD